MPQTDPFTYVVDGHETDHPDSPEAGDGQFPPFRIFMPDEQDYLPGAYLTREGAQRVADMLTAKLVRRPDNEATGKPIGAEMEEIITIALGDYACRSDVGPAWRKLAEDYAHALQNDTYLLETPCLPDMPLLDKPICETAEPAPLDRSIAEKMVKDHRERFPAVAAAWAESRPAEAVPEVVVPMPDDPKYTQLFDRMLGIVESLVEASKDENVDLLADTEKRAARLLEDMRPEPAPPPKQFHSGWNKPWEEAECTCAGTWLEAFTHLDEALKEMQADGPPHEESARQARAELWSLADGEREGWARHGDDTFWIAELKV